MRFAHWMLAGIMIYLFAGVAAAADPAMKPIIDLKEIAGEWTGSLVGPGGSVPYTLIVKDDGTWNASSPRGQTNGTVAVKNGTAEYKSSSTGRTGKYTLHEDGGKRVLKLTGEGGVSAELTPKK
jgi:hypothetical protein